MKKVLSIVLSLAMVVCMMPLTAFAASTNSNAEYSDIVGEKCEGAVNVLSALGVVNGYEDGTYKPANIVTRAEMAKLIITALGMDSYATATTSSYTDMANAKWAVPVVEYATNLGIINGYGNGKFGPNDTVTYEQAATMIVRALGFTTDCNEMNGTYPAIYIQKATALGLFKDVAGNQYGTGANRGDIAIMLYNALNTPEVYADKDGQTHNKTGENGANITMMSTLNKGGTSEYAVLTPEDANDAITNVMDLIGAAGKIVKDKNGKVLSIGDIQTVFLTGDYNGTTKKFVVGDTEYSLASKLYTVFVKGTTNGKTEEAENQTVAYFENNESGTDAALAAESGKKVTYTIACKVSGTTIKNIYSIAKWDASAAKQVKSGDIKKITSDKTLLGSDFQKDDNGAIDTSKFILNGVNSLSDISEDNIVAVYANDANKITKVEVGTKVVSGKVTKVTSGDSPKYTVDGTAYKVSTLPGKTSSLPGVGDESTIYLDYDGKIYVTDDIETGYNYGVVLKPQGENSTYDSDDQLIKILGSNGNATIYTLKKDVNTSAQAGDLVKFKLNSDNKISSIIIADENADGSKYKNGVIGGKLVADKAVAFIITDTDLTDEDSYDVSTPSAITDNITKSQLFTNKDGEIVAIIADEKSTDNSDIYGLISSSSLTKNSKDDTVFELEGVANGAAFTALTKDQDDKYVTEDNVLVKITKSGDDIKSVVKASIETAEDVVAEKNFKDDTVYMYSNSVAVAYAVKGGDLTAYQVLKVSGDRVQIGRPATSDVTEDTEYQTIKGATVYIPKLDSDKAFDSWAIGSVDDISVNGYVVLLQTNDKSSNWDTIIYIPDGKDYQKLVAAK